MHSAVYTTASPKMTESASDRGTIISGIKRSRVCRSKLSGTVGPDRQVPIVLPSTDGFVKNIIREAKFWPRDRWCLVEYQNSSTNVSAAPVKLWKCFPLFLIIWWGFPSTELNGQCVSQLRQACVNACFHIRSCFWRRKKYIKEIGRTTMYFISLFRMQFKMKIA